MASIFRPGGGTPASGDVYYDPTNAFKSGSRHWFMHKVADYAGSSATDDWVQGPGRVDFTLTPSTSKTEVEWEDGTKQTTNVSVSWEASIKTAQKDKGTVYTIYDVGNGLVIQFLMEMTPDAVVNVNSTSKRQYITFMATITDPPAIGAKATEVEIKASLGVATGSGTINLATGYTGSTTFPNFGAATGSVAWTSGKYFTISEV